MRHILTIAGIAALIAAIPVDAAAQGTLTIDSDQEIRPIGLMNGVGGGPCGIVSPEMYKAAGIPFARYHDVGGAVKHCVELLDIFPVFDADENKEENYDFTITDQYVKRTLDAGTKILWRLGNAEHEPRMLRKYGGWPPTDFKKWARICEHVVRHYNEGWADGFHYDIQHWEIWNEPDGDQRLLTKTEALQDRDKDKVGKEPRYKIAPHSWGGTMQEYYNLYAITFKHLKKCFPSIRIGGPANAGFSYNEPFIKEMQKRGVKVDFFSWHRYSRNPEALSTEGLELRHLLDSLGWNDVPTILDEWNYVTTWDAGGADYSAKVRGSIKGSAYTAAVMCHMQNEACTDALSYNAFLPSTSYCGAFNRETGVETATYYAFTAWNELRMAGTQVKTTCTESDIYSVAAKDMDGRIFLLVARFNDNDSISGSKTISVCRPGSADGKIRCLLNDRDHTNCEYPFPTDKDGRLVLSMKPNSFVFVRF